MVFVSFLGAMYIERNLRGTLGDLVPIRRTNMMCVGNELSISECSFDGGDGDDTCTHADDVIIICDFWIIVGYYDQKCTLKSMKEVNV